MNRLIRAVLLTALGLNATAQAQERSAGQAYDAQVNWAALSNKLDLLDSQNKMLAAAMERQGEQLAKMTACNAKTMLWSPSSTTPVPDGEGCVSAVGAITADPSTQVQQNWKGNGWNWRACPEGYVMVGGYWSDSDSWGMYCRKLIAK